MKKFFGALVLIISLVLTACGRDNQGGQPMPNQPPVGPAVEQPVDYGNAGGYVGGYCGLLCRWRMRRQQRLGGCY